MRSLRLLSVVAPLLVVLTPERASACGPGGTHYESHAAPVGGQMVPANLPAVAISRGLGNGSPCTVAGVSLLDSAGQAANVLPSASEPDVYLLDKELTNGSSYTLSYEENCKVSWGPTTKALSSTFAVGEPRPFPATTGKLKVVDQGRGYISYNEFSCSSSGDRSWARIQLTPDCHLVPFLAATRFVARFEGSSFDWATSKFGSLEAAQNQWGHNKTVDLVWRNCDGPGSATATLLVEARIPGAAIQPLPAQIALSLPCDQDAGATPVPGSGTLDVDGACAAPDGGSADAAIADVHVPDSLPPDPDAAPDAPREPGPAPRDPRDSREASRSTGQGGLACGVARSGRSHSGAGLVAIAFVLALGRTRTCMRRRPSKSLARSFLTE